MGFFCAGSAGFALGISSAARTDSYSTTRHTGSDSSSADADPRPHPHADAVARANTYANATTHGYSGTDCYTAAPRADAGDPVPEPSSSAESGRDPWRS